MNISRLRELTAAGQAGTIRSEELKELFEALPKFIGDLRGDLDWCLVTLSQSADVIEDACGDIDSECEHVRERVRVMRSEHSLPST